MAITTPWSAALTRDEGKRDVTIGTAATLVNNKIVLGLGANVEPAKRQQVAGVVRKLLRWHLNRLATAPTTGVYVKGNWMSANDGNIEREAAVPTADDVSLAIHGGFGSTVGINGLAAAKASHFIEETVDQLLDTYLERSKSN